MIAMQQLMAEMGNDYVMITIRERHLLEKVETRDMRTAGDVPMTTTPTNELFEQILTLLWILLQLVHEVEMEDTTKTVVMFVKLVRSHAQHAMSHWLMNVCLAQIFMQLHLLQGHVSATLVTMMLTEHRI